MSLSQERFHARVNRIKNLICVCLIFLILLLMASPFFPKGPTREQLAFARTLCYEGTGIFDARWKLRIIPFLGSKQGEIWFILPDDVSFENWYSNTFRKIGATEIEVAHDFITAVAKTREGATVRIRAELHSQSVHCHLTFH